MLTDAQFKQLERDLWTTTTHPHVYALMRDNLELRIECKDRKSTRLNSSHSQQSRMPSSA